MQSSQKPVSLEGHRVSCSELVKPYFSKEINGLRNFLLDKLDAFQYGSTAVSPSVPRLAKTSSAIPSTCCLFCFRQAQRDFEIESIFSTGRQKKLIASVQASFKIIGTLFSKPWDVDNTSDFVSKLNHL